MRAILDPRRRVVDRNLRGREEVVEDDEEAWRMEGILTGKGNWRGRKMGRKDDAGIGRGILS